MLAELPTMATTDQVKSMPYTGKKDNTGIVTKLNELIDHIAHNTGIVKELKATVNDLKVIYLSIYAHWP